MQIRWCGFFDKAELVRLTAPKIVSHIASYFEKEQLDNQPDTLSTRKQEKDLSADENLQLILSTIIAVPETEEPTFVKPPAGYLQPFHEPGWRVPAPKNNWRSRNDGHSRQECNGRSLQGGIQYWSSRCCATTSPLHDFLGNVRAFMRGGTQTFGGKV